MQGPLAVANVEVVDPTKPISIVPILRAGLTLVEKAHEVLPTTKTYHLGCARDEKNVGGDEVFGQVTQSRVLEGR